MQTLLNRIENAGHIVLIAHRDPDADSMGSASAMYTHLLRLQKKVTLFCVTERYDRHLDFLPWVDTLKHRFPENADLAIAFDCAAFGRLGAVPECDLINIDHHASNEGYGTQQYIDPTAISTTQVLFDLFKAAAITINPKMATALYAGLIDDSLGFTTVKTDRRAFLMAAELAEAGADIAACNRHLVQTVSLAATRLKGRMLQELELLEEGTVAYLRVDRALLDATGAREVDCEAALNEALYLPTVETAILLRDNRDGSLKGSLRSRGNIDLFAVARRFGGGGHRHAAGFEVRNTDATSVRDTLLNYLNEG
jgi:bifunctional oligoribonuclease and PAP phosphatase NrnA